MVASVKELKDKAERGRNLYRMGIIDRNEAKQAIEPYIIAVNERSKELAKKYNQRPRLTNFNAFVR